MLKSCCCHKQGPLVGAVTAAIVLMLTGCQATPQAELSSDPTPPTTAVPPPPPPQGAFLAQLSPAVKQQLDSLGVVIAVPTSLPAQMSLVAVETRPDPPYYLLVYRDDRDRCFAIEFAPEGNNPAGADQTLPLQPPQFANGEYQLHYSQAPAVPQLRSDWLSGEAGFYRLVGATYINERLQGQAACRDIAPEEAVQIINSLVYLGQGEDPLDIDGS